MSLAKSILMLAVFVVLAALCFSGCGKASPPAKNEPAQTAPPATTSAGETGGATTPEPAPQGGFPPASTETAPAPEHFLRLISPPENAIDVDPKLPLEWRTDPGDGKVITLNISIAEIGPDGKPYAIYCAVFIRGMDPAMTAMSKWTAFEAEMDKNWMFTGDEYNRLKQLKPNTKYVLEVGVSLDNRKQDSVERIFTTK